MNFARLEINEKLGTLIEELPYGVSLPRISHYIPKEIRELQGFLTYILSANLSANEIRKYAIDYLRTPLLAVDGVSDVNIRGGNEREILITIDYDKAKLFGITNEEIVESINNAEKIISAGAVKKNGSQVLVKIDNYVSAAEVLLHQPVKLMQNSIIRLKDIGNVFDDFSERRSYYRINGKEAIFIEISKEQGKNTIQVADNVYAKLNELEINFPPGFSLIKEIDMSQNIRNEISELFRNAGYSFLIILFVLFLFFRKRIYSFIIITSILFSLLLSFILFYLFEIPFNILTIASLILGFGLMVDNSIVVVDYLDKHYYERGLKYAAVYVKNIFFPVFTSTLTTIAVFIPLTFLTGELKLYFEQFALAIAITLSGSLVISFTVIPLLFIKYGFKKKTYLQVDSAKSYGFRLYSFLIQKIFTWKKAAIIFLILILGLPVWLLPSRIETPGLSIPYNTIFDSETFADIKKYFNYAFGGTLNLFFNHVQKGEVFSYGETDYIIVRLQLPHGNRIERINELTQRFEKEVLAYNENIDNITANVLDEENAIIRINFNKEQSQTAFPYLLKNYLTAFAVNIGGLNVSVYGFGPGFYSGGTSISSFSVASYGFNYNKLKDIANHFKQIIEKNPRVDNVDIDKSGFWERDEDTYEIVAAINRESLIRNNIEVNNLFDLIAKNTRGNLGYNKFRIGNEEVAYSVKFSNYRNIQQDDLSDLIIKSNNLNQLKVKDIVAFNEQKVLASINRENQQYVRNIRFDYKGPYKYGDEFVESSIKQMQLPEGFSVMKRKFTFLFGQEDEINIWNILAISLILIFMITAALFESIKKPFLIIFAVPFALIGTIFLFYLGDYNLDRGAYAGMLLLIGLSVNNSIILVDYLSKNLNNHNLIDVIKLSYNRIRPIFTTTFTTIAALIPLMINPEQSFWKGLSLSVTGGILISTTLIIIYIPLFYFILHNKKF